MNEPAEGRRRRRLDADTRRGELLRAALVLFATQDVDSVGIDEVAAAADASPGTIYRYFGSKQGLAVAALELAAQEMVERLQPDEHAPAAVQLAQGLTSYLDYLQEHPVSWSALLRAGSNQTDRVAAVARRVDDHALLLAHRALGSTPAAVVLDVGLRGWLALVKQVCLGWLSPGAAVSRDSVEHLLFSAFLAVVAAAGQVEPAAADAAARLSAGGPST